MSLCRTYKVYIYQYNLQRTWRRNAAPCLEEGGGGVGGGGGGVD